MGLTLRSSFPVTSGAAPLLATAPTGVAVNDLILALVVTADDVTPTPPGGFVLVATIAGTTHTSVYQKIAGSSEPSSYWFNWTGGNNGTVAMIAIDSTTLTYPVVHQTNTASSESSSTSKTWNGVTNTDTNTLLLCFGGFGSNATSTPDASMTERVDSSNPRAYLMSQAVAASGATGTRTAAGNSVATQRCITVSITESNTNPITYPAEEWVTEMPVLVEVASDGGSYVTQMGVLVEIAATGIHLTESPILVEIGAVGVFVTSLPVLIEIEYVEPVEPIVAVHKYANAGSRALHRILPNEISGYAFDPELSWWSVVVPEATENLIINPSFEVYDTFGYDWVVLGWGSVTAVDDSPVGATRDLFCLKLVGNSLGEGEFWYGGDADAGGLLHVTPGGYTWSLDIYSASSYGEFELEIRAAGGSTIRKRRYSNVESGWKRYHMTFVEGGSEDIELVFRDVTPGLIPATYYLDAWQFEKKLYPTTYCDGDMVGYYDTNPTQSYYWRSIPHRSASVRQARTGSGGREVSLSDEFGLYTTGIIGLGMSPIEGNIQELANGKELFRGSNSLPRDFTITCRLFAENYSLLASKRNELIKLIAPNNTPQREPLLLRHQPTDDKGRPYGLPLEIICAYSNGLQGNITNFYQETLPLQFHASNPFLSETIDSAAELLLDMSLTPMGLVYRDSDMEYGNIDPGTTGGVDFDFVSKAAFAYSGSIIAVIQIVADTGDLDFSGLLNMSTNIVMAVRDNENAFTWQEFGSGYMTIGSFNALASNFRQGSFFVLGGDFTRDDTVDVWNNILVGRMADDGVITPGIIPINNMPTGLNDEVWAIEAHSDTDFYVGGAFDDLDGVVGTDWMHFFRLKTDEGIGESYAQAVLGGVGGTVYAIRSDKARYVYVGGGFTNVYSSPGLTDPVGANNIIIYDTLEDVWIQMGTINYIGVNGTVGDIQIDKDGTVYIIGDFLTYSTSLIPLTKIGRWNGYTWEEPFAFGFLWTLGLSVEEVKFEIAPDGILWFYSRDAVNGFEAVPGVGDCHMFGWRNNIFYAPPYEVRGTSPSQAVSDLRFLDNGEMIITFVDLNTSLRVPYLNRVQYNGNADAYPDIILQSAQPQFIINHTVDSSIYFKQNAILNNLERMHIDLSSLRANVFSNLRSELGGFIQSGATNISDFRLMPGENRISCFMRNHVAGDTGAIVWRNQFWSIDAAVSNELYRGVG